MSLRRIGFASQIATAAAAGLALGACSKKEAPHNEQQGAVTAVAVATAEGDKQCCMGLNDCKGKGGCAVPESHSCMGKNDCKGKGGCNMHCPKK